ncbi:MAG: hypothetical protein STSR0006_15250 [Lentimicrobium sp.]
MANKTLPKDAWPPLGNEFAWFSVIRKTALLVQQHIAGSAIETTLDICEINEETLKLIKESLMTSETLKEVVLTLATEVGVKSKKNSYPVDENEMGKLFEQWQTDF